MRLLVDGIAFQNNYQRGIQRFYREIFSRLGKLHSIEIMNEVSAIAALPANCSIPKPDLSAHPRRWHIIAQAKRRIRRKIRSISRPNFDLFCSTYYTPSPYPNLPEAVVVYDLVHEKLLWSAEDAEGQMAAKQGSLRRGVTYIAISQATADELKKYYPETASRIRVVHPGCDHLPESENNALTLSDGAPDAEYVLFVGSRGAYKNFGVILDAMVSPNWPADVKLAIVGKPLTTNETLVLQGRGLGPRVLTPGQLSDGELAKWYRRSLGFVFPSLQEGFGFPNLEAQSCGAPVVCSDIPVFHETCDDSAIYFDPRSPESVAAAIQKLRSPDLRGKLRELGSQNICRFTWDQCASLIAMAFEEAARLKLL